MKDKDKDSAKVALQVSLDKQLTCMPLHGAGVAGEKLSPLIPLRKRRASSQTEVVPGSFVAQQRRKNQGQAQRPELL
jgi:hypothetical protein